MFQSWLRWPFLLAEEYLPGITIREAKRRRYREDIEATRGVSAGILISVVHRCVNRRCFQVVY